MINKEYIEEFNAYKKFVDNFEGELVEIHQISRREKGKWIEREVVKVFNKDWFIKDLEKAFELKEVSERAFDNEMRLWFSFLRYVKEEIEKKNKK